MSVRRIFVNLAAALLALPYRARLGRLGRRPRLHPPLRLARSRRIEIGDGAVIEAGATLSAAPHGRIVIGDSVEIRSFAVIESDAGLVALGDRCSVNCFCVLNGFGGLEIGHDVRIASHAVILSSEHRHDDASASIQSQGIQGRKTRVGDDVWIGAHAVIRGGVTVGSHSIVGAGAVVTRDVPAYAVVAGVPARVIRMRNGQA